MKFSEVKKKKTHFLSAHLDFALFKCKINHLRGYFQYTSVYFFHRLQGNTKLCPRRTVAGDSYMII